MISEKYSDYYFQLCNKRILFYNAIDNSDNTELSNSACNFLCALNTFEKEVPREIIKEKFEDFRRAKNLAKEILRSCSYRDYYFQLCNKRIFLYNSIQSEEPYETIERARNFLAALKLFRRSVSRRVIRKKFENFEDDKGLAKEILKDTTCKN